MTDFKTINVSEETKQRLEALKAHPRSSYEEVIEKLLSDHKALKKFEGAKA